MRREVTVYWEEQGRLCKGGGFGGGQQVEMAGRVAGASRLPCFKQ